MWTKGSWNAGRYREQLNGAPGLLPPATINPAATANMLVPWYEGGYKNAAWFVQYTLTAPGNVSLDVVANDSDGYPLAGDPVQTLIAGAAYPAAQGWLLTFDDSLSPGNIALYSGAAFAAGAALPSFPTWNKSPSLTFQIHNLGAGVLTMLENEFILST